MNEQNAGLVLLVDDDAVLRRAMKDFLTQSGCRVIEARDAYDGLFACAQFGNEIGLLVTELNLLPVSGVKLAENVLRLWPRIQVICTSSNADATGVDYWMRYLNAQFLPKPFSAFQLHEKVFSLIGTRMEAATCMPNAVQTLADPGPIPSPWGEVRPEADGCRPSSNTEDPLFWLKEF